MMVGYRGQRRYRASRWIRQWGCIALVAIVSLMPGRGEAETEPLTFTIVGLGGQVFDLTDYRGQWVVVNFWATWCKPCRKEMPDLSALHTERADVTVLGLAFEEVEESAIYAFLEDFPAAYPIAIVDVYDPPEVFGIPRVLPTTIMVSPSGHNEKTFVGPVTREDLEAYVDGAESG